MKNTVVFAGLNEQQPKGVWEVEKTEKEPVETHIIRFPETGVTERIPAT